MEKLNYRPVDSSIRAITMFLSMLSLASAVYMLFQGKMGDAVLGGVLFFLFLFFLIVQGIMTHLSENIRSTKIVLDYLKNKGLLPSIRKSHPHSNESLLNENVIHLLYQIDRVSVQRRQQSLTRHVWMKRNNNPDSSLVQKIIKSYEANTLPEMPKKFLTPEEASLVDEVASMNETELEREIRTEGFNEISEGNPINLKTV